MPLEKKRVSFLSAGASFLFFNFCILVSGRWIFVPKARSVALAYFVSALLGVLVLVNVNQFVGLRQAFPFLALLLIPLGRAFFRFDGFTKREVLSDLFSLIALQVSVLIALSALLLPQRYWLLEGPNHDSIVYFEGMSWALEYPLLVSKDAVDKIWRLGTCGDGGGLYIGWPCALYRGGTYTLAAWAQMFSPEKTAYGLWAIFPFSALFFWLSVRRMVERFGFKPARMGLAGLTLLGALLPTFSAANISSLANSNLATVPAAAVIASVVSLLLTYQGDSLWETVVLGLLVSAGAHFYGESIVYTGFLVGVFFGLMTITQYFSGQSGVLKNNVRHLFLVGLVALVAGNVAILGGFRSLSAINAVASGGNWESWYLAKPLWTWLGAFPAAELLGHRRVSLWSVTFCGAVITILAFTGAFAIKQAARCGAIVLAVFSALLVGFVIHRNYAYGEHKILQLLGPSWLALLAFAGFSKISRFQAPKRSGRFDRGILSAGIFCVGFVSINMAIRASALFSGFSREHGIQFGVSDFAAFLQPDDVVALDDSAWSGIDGFQKSHYAAFMINKNGARVVMPDLGDNMLRGGYYRRRLNASLRITDAVDWILRRPGGSIFHVDGAATEVSPDFELLAVGKPCQGIALPASGWLQCEKGSCQVSSSFGLEVFVPKTCKGASILQVQMRYFATQSEVRVESPLVHEKLKMQPGVSESVIRVPLERGWQQVFVHSKVQSQRRTDSFEDMSKLGSGVAVVSDVRVVTQ